MGRRLSLQVYEGVDGGWELFICGTAQTEATGPQATAFEAVSPLLCLCRHLEETGYAGGSRLLRDGAGWYLVVEGEAPLPAAEFGESLAGDRLAYLNEYAVTVLESDAVARLAALAQMGLPS